MTPLPETITIAGAALTKQETDDSAERPMYCDNDSCVWLGDAMVQIEEMVAETRAAFARLAGT